jgi:peptide/nickel transport system ATP-binding protein
MTVPGSAARAGPEGAAAPGAAASTAAAPPLLEIDDLVKRYRLPRQGLLAPAPLVHALNGVTLRMACGRHLGIVGESGSGKSTLARLVMALESPTSGRVRLLGQDLHALDARRLRAARTQFQMVFQDPYGSLDPRQPLLRIVGEPLEVLEHVPRAERRERCAEMLDAVGLRAADLHKYPHEFSGGQRQRIAIARALVTRPRLIVADEPVSALDVSVQAQVLNLMQDLAERFKLSYFFISHDLAVVDHLCAEVAVLYGGCVVEQGPPRVLFRAAAHPYTQALLRAVPPEVPAALRPAMPAAPVPTPPPHAGRPAIPIAAEAGPLAHNAPGCSYAPRCAQRVARCTRESPVLHELAPGHHAACHLASTAGPAAHGGR